jgi:hypothetical protein
MRDLVDWNPGGPGFWSILEGGGATMGEVIAAALILACGALPLIVAVRDARNPERMRTGWTAWLYGGIERRRSLRAISMFNLAAGLFLAAVSVGFAVAILR